MITVEDRARFHAQLQRRRGRPRVIIGPAIKRSVSLPEPVYDAICRRAIASGRSVESVIRAVLTSYTTAISGFEK
jgi:hypothetical protein